MSFPNRRHLPLLQIIDALAGDYGYHLAPNMPIRSPLDVKLDHLAAELAQLETPHLIERVVAIQVDADRMDKKMQALRKGYGEADTSLKGITLPGLYDSGNIMPAQLRLEEKWVHEACRLAVCILGRRVAEAVLTDIEAPPPDVQAEIPPKANPAA